MRKKLLLLGLVWVISSMWWAIMGLAQAPCTLSLSASGSSFPTGASITLTATPSGTCQSISQVAFYNGTSLIGIITKSPYSITWNTTGLSPQAYSLTAAAEFVGSTGGSGGITIDVVGDPADTGAAALNQTSFGDQGGSGWVPGDSQMCLTTWPYNGSPTMSMLDGTCESTAPVTEDSLDDTLHALSDFVKFADNFLSNDVGTLSSTFSTWFDQADVWIDPATGRLPPLAARLSTWNTLMTNWLNNTYTNSSAWCLPPTSTGSVSEDNYITAISGTATWGDLPHIVACLNYNASVPTNNYQACYTALTLGTCPSALPAVCSATALGRSLVGPAPVYDGCTGNYAKWVSDSLTLATDEAPKFALRGQFLGDMYTRANTLNNISGQGSTAISNFLSGPAAQLIAAHNLPSPTSLLPNSVIYGWVDNLPSGGSGGCTDTSGNRVGCAHIVKVTAYSPGRIGNSTLPLPVPQSGGSLLPWIKTSTSGFLALTRSYTLTDRDGYVYVSVRRWDEDHGNILFPNGHPLWQMLFHNPQAGGATSGQDLMQGCNGLPGHLGFGLEQQTVNGLAYQGTAPSFPVSTADMTALGNAFMLNDEGTGPGRGKVDSYAMAVNAGGYISCLNATDALLNSAPESHMCAEYIASRNASGASGDGDSDYSLKFVGDAQCPPQPEDLMGNGGGGL